MPLTAFQRTLLRTMAENRSPESHLAGGAALHFAPSSLRFSKDLDFFHDSEVRVAEAFSADRELLERAGFTVQVELTLPGHVRAVVSHEGEATRIDWAHDSAWRFMPAVRDEAGGYLLHEVDLAINKLLALAGRDEPRDFVDTLYVHERVLPLGALVWAAAGKDPGLSPHSLLELLKRRGRPRQEELDRLDLVEPLDASVTRDRWREALADAEAFVASRPPDELGCLYYASDRGRFVAPEAGSSLEAQRVVTHFGAPGGVIPVPTGATIAPEGH